LVLGIWNLFVIWSLHYGDVSSQYGNIDQMRYAILADIHANLEALSAVLADIAHQGGADEYWVLGDIVNYGPDPGACIELLRGLPLLAVYGNHDLAAVGKFSAAFFNADAAAALDWTARQINKTDAIFLESLPQTIEQEGFTLVHGSPRAPVTEYLLSIPAASQNFGVLATRHALVGHTHIPAVFKLEDSGRVLYLPFTDGIGLSLGEGRFIVNPGSVGQPRDGDPRASSAVYDNEFRIIRLHRVEYDIKATRVKMMAANLPPRLAARLEKGL
jgi:diadenosine tetraphosphatase ApaH/serine/threonine PP2A family protein phosphatase